MPSSFNSARPESRTASISSSAGIWNRPRYPKSLAKPPTSATFTFPRNSSAPTRLLKPGAPSLGIHHENRRLRLRNHLSSADGSMTTSVMRRIVSAPEPSEQRTFLHPAPIKAVLHTPPLTEDSLCSLSDNDASSCPSDSSLQDDLLIHHPLLRLPEAKANIPQRTGIAKPPTPSHVIGTEEDKPAPAPPSQVVPVSDTQGVLLTTSYLTSQTHKVSRGQVTILPSLSLLIDFREGERRSGRKGVEVLCVSSDGRKV